MKPATTVFQLGRMRHIDLLAIWHRLHPDLHDQQGRAAARMITGQLVASILASLPAGRDAA